MRVLACVAVMLMLVGCGGSSQTTGDVAASRPSAPTREETAGGELSLTLTMPEANETVVLQPRTRFTKQKDPTDHLVTILAATEGISLTSTLELGAEPNLLPGEFQHADNRPEVYLFWRHPEKAKAQEGLILICHLQGVVAVSAVHPDRTFDGSLSVSTPKDCWLGKQREAQGPEFVSDMGQVSLTGTLTNVPLPKGVD